jgi:hypothetical protein
MGIEEGPTIFDTYSRTRIFLKRGVLQEKMRMVKFLERKALYSARYPNGWYVFIHTGKKKSRYLCAVEDWPVMANPNPTVDNPDHFIIYKRQ